MTELMEAAGTPEGGLFMKRVVCLVITGLLLCSGCVTKAPRLAENMNRELSWKDFFERGCDNQNAGNYEQAIEDYTRAIELKPDDARSYDNRGLTHQKIGDYSLAINDFTTAVAINPSYAKGYVDRGDLRWEQGDLVNAADDYTRAISIDPDAKDLYLNRAKLYSDQQEYSLALMDLNKALQLDPRYFKAYINRGIIYYDIGRYDFALKDYTTALNIDPENSATYNNMSWLYATADAVYKDGQKAVAYAERAIGMDRDALLYLDTLATAYVADRQYQKAYDTYLNVMGTIESQISAYQQSLKIQGYYTGPIDGIAGPRMQKALYQCVHDGRHLSGVSATTLAQETILPKTKSFLWKITSRETRVYILGSMHLGNPGFFPLNPAIEKAFTDTDILAVEVNPFLMAEKAVQRFIIENGIYPGEETLKDHVSKETYRELTSWLSEKNIPEASLIKMKPGMISMVLDRVILNNVGFHSEYGIDIHFCHKAIGLRPIISLETFEEQLSMIFDMPDQSLYLKYLLHGLKGEKARLDDMVQAWKQGDAGVFEAIVFKSLTTNPEFEPVFEKILYKRNVNMADRVKEMLENRKRCFVIVGSAHLVGDKGILALLQKQGFTVEQL